MSRPYTVGRRPDRLDRIARAIDGTERPGSVEALLAANPGLAAQISPLPKVPR